MLVLCWKSQALSRSWKAWKGAPTFSMNSNATRAVLGHQVRIIVLGTDGGAVAEGDEAHIPKSVPVMWPVTKNGHAVFKGPGWDLPAGLVPNGFLPGWKRQKKDRCVSAAVFNLKLNSVYAF